MEKPESFVSTLINCGVYVFHPSVFETLGDIYQTQVQMARYDFKQAGMLFVSKTDNLMILILS